MPVVNYAFDPENANLGEILNSCQFLGNLHQNNQSLWHTYALVILGSSQCLQVCLRILVVHHNISPESTLLL